MKILVVGGGGREHALVWKIKQSPLVEKIYCAPGNPGIGQLAQCVNIEQNDINGLLGFARKKSIDLTVVGPEEPLVSGIVDEFEDQGLTIFGPSKAAAELEGSKVFSKYVLQKYNIPTAECVVLEKYDEAKVYVQNAKYPTVIKADGLAAGKGTFICKNEEEALSALNKIMLEKVFADAGNKVVIEEFMRGEEASIIAITDGETLGYLPAAQDHKAIFDNDEGPNTGGMGAYAPAPVINEPMFERVKKEIMEPTIRAMALENRPYRGILYAGLMITKDGPKVVEFNCRFGDPETQVILPLLSSDIVDIMFRVVKGKRFVNRIERHEKSAMCVVVASGGYPGPYEKGSPIYGLDKKFGKSVHIFHAGTRQLENNCVVTNGGRVLGVTAVEDNFLKAREKAYWALGKIAFNNAYYRKDIGAKAIKYLKKH